MNPQVIRVVSELLETWVRAEKIKTNFPAVSTECDEIIAQAKAAVTGILSAL